ncbi:protein-glutamate methylesterase/protein-glutamine glutaminase [Parasulfitobacter algicola]|uniref:Protein-glutamate methylesterase/protein-glutamine glutaminase n=1 Tax=Parasulfitobacter algicola TaxID=2614809 RepID=A0ABX2ITU8_9RHOB|nr:chemotaxis response regulator protein-glutamate methylesterase [Sulfitobacter algicola]NSX56339.1 chemotaxis response regulator protein-glutamate methylesterase [Sulfitobacter algicola]
MQLVRVLIVDDSATARSLIRTNLMRDRRFSVVGEAATADEARAAIKRLNPDVLTLDIEMPKMNGLEFLKRLMKLRPMPVLMVSSQTEKGSQRALEALSLGAVDCIGKPSAFMNDELKTLPDRLYIAANAQTRTLNNNTPKAAKSDWIWNGKTVFLGASTGGVGAIETVLSTMPEDCPPILISQHMPSGFIESLAQRLDRMFAPGVQVAEDGQEITPGQVYLAPGGKYDLVLDQKRGLHCKIINGEPNALYSPSVDVMFKSAVGLGKKSIGVLLTGMGRDGADGMKAMRNAGAQTIAQDEGTCVVYGMPKAACDIGAVVKTVELNKTADFLMAATRSRSEITTK